MAEIAGVVLAPIVAVVGPAYRARKYVRDYKKNLDKLQEEMTHLEDRMEAIERQVNEARDRGEEIEEDVSRWRRDTNAMQIDFLVFGESTCSRLDIKRRYRLGKEAEKKMADVRRLTERSYKFNKISHRKPPPPELEFPSDENYVSMDSRTPIFEGIVNAIKHSGVNVIGVHGLGGVGKTTLVMQIADKMQADGTFKQVLLALVSQYLYVMGIQKKLADQLNLPPLDATASEKDRASQLLHKFKNGGKYLVILDDIWAKVDLNTIGIPIGDSCKVVLTSRNKDLLEKTMNANKTFAIAELTEPEAWTLFKKVVGNSIEPRNEMAKEVCRRCKGLPLAINALGAALKGEPDHAWKDALIKLQRNCPTEIVGIDPGVWASLELSYEKLQHPISKSCFLLCCLFPEDADIPIDCLTRLCVARRLLSPNPRNLEEARHSVLNAVNSLKSAYLLSHGIDEYGINENFVRVQGVIRDVVISMARHQEEAFLVDHGAFPPSGSSFSAISITFKGIKGLPNELVYPKLHTLMLYSSDLSDVEVADNFFVGMPQLTVLTITRMRMRRLPSSLAKLANLRMLHLIKCDLEDIGILKDLNSNLEVLSLEGSSIKALPDIGQLTSLRVLDLQGCYELNVIPQGVISNLTSLEELYFPMYVSDCFCWEELKRSLSTRQLTTLHIHIQDVTLLTEESPKFENLKRFFISMGRIGVRDDFQGTRVLCLGGDDDVPHECSYLRNDLIPLVEKAEILHLENFTGLKKVLHDRGVGNEFSDFNPLFNNLTMLIVTNCKLKHLLTPTAAKGLAHLQRLTLEDCEIMEEVVGSEGHNYELIGEVRFNKLKRLELSRLPSLICFCAEKEKQQTTMEGSLARPQHFFNEQIIFPVLETLIIHGVDNIVEIWDNESMAGQGSFCQLRNVDVKSCEKLLHLFPFEMHPRLSHLQRLTLENCDFMEEIVGFGGQNDEFKDDMRFSRLRQMELRGLPKLICFYAKKEKKRMTVESSSARLQPFFNEQIIFPVLETLIIHGVDNIVEIWDNESMAGQGSFCQLRNVDVKSCEKLLHLFPFEMHPRLSHLQRLTLENCDFMEEIVGFGGQNDEFIDDMRFSRLRQMELRGLPKLICFYAKKEKKRMTVESSSARLQPFFNEQIIFPVLETLTIHKVDNIVELWDEESMAVFVKQGSFSQLGIVDTDIKGIDQKVSALRLSYHMSGSFNAKSCILLCCLYHAHAEISIDDLTRHCVRRRLLSSNPHTLHEARNAVLAAIDALQSDSLLSKGDNENCVKIQDVIRAIGISILWKETAFLVDHHALEWPRNPAYEPSYSGISISFEDIKVLPSSLEYPRLHTLMVDNKKLSDVEIPGNFFDGMPQLEVLTFTRMRMPRPPFSLAKLDKLQMLYLNQCKVEDIAILTDLRSNLVSLSLLGSSIKVLSDIGRLTSLQVLDLKDCNELKEIPQGVISKLKSLEELYFPMTFDFRFLEELKESLRNGKLTTLHIRIWDVKLLPKEGLKFEKLKRFMISTGQMWGHKYFQGTEVLYCRRSESSDPSQHTWFYLRNEFIPSADKVETLRLNRMDLKEVLHHRGVRHEFPDLKHLEVESRDDDLKHILREPRSLSFTKLTVLIVTCCKLKYLFSPTTARSFVHLERLEVGFCKIMEAIVGFEEQNKRIGEVRFSGLKKLKLWGLPNLISFYARKEKQQTTTGSSLARLQPLFNEQIIFPVLESLTIWGVGNIREIWDKQSVVAVKEGSFCQLTDVYVRFCKKLKHVFPSNMSPLLKNLEKLHADECESMEGIVGFEGEQDEYGLRNNDCFSKLKILKLWNAPNLEKPLFNGKVFSPALEELSIDNVPKIKKIWDRQPKIKKLWGKRRLPDPEKDVESYSKHVDISVRNCDRLLYVFPPYIVHKLQKLTIVNCKEMEVILSKELKEKEATKNVPFVFPQLKALELQCLPKLKRICTATQLFFPDKDAFPMLTLEEIKLGKKLEFLRKGTSTEEASMEERSASGKERDCGKEIDHNGEGLDEDLCTPSNEVSVEECSTSGKERDCGKEIDHNREGLNEDLCIPSNKDAFPASEIIELDESLEFLRNGSSTKKASMEVCSTSGK